jgi:hypothetical protein
MVLTVLAFAASAAPMQWSWPETDSRRYLVEMKVQTPYVMYLLEGANKEVRVTFVALQAVIDCKVHETLPKDKGWTVQCPISDASFFAVPINSDTGRSQPVVDDYERLLEGATVEYRLGRDGRVSAVRLLGIDAHDERSTYIADRLTRYVERGMAALDVQLPTDEPAPASWAHKPFLAAEMPIATLPMGSVKATEALAERTGDVQSMALTATGSLMVGSDVWNITGRGTSAFDQGSGAIVASVVQISSVAGSTTIEPNTIPFQLIAQITAVAPGTVVQLVPSTGW